MEKIKEEIKKLNMTIFKESSTDLSKYAFDESKFRDFLAVVRTSYNIGFTLNWDKFLNIWNKESYLISQAFRSERYFTSTIEIVHNFALKGRSRLDGVKWTNLAWLIFITNKEIIEETIQHGNSEQSWAILSAVKELALARRVSGQVKDPTDVDFLVRNLESTTRTADDKTRARDILQAILGHGNDRQVQFAREFILRAFDDKDLPFRFSALGWIAHLTLGTASAKVRVERNLLEKHFLEKYQLPDGGIVEALRENGTLEKNLVAICELEAQEHGITKTLNREFGISNFGRYPSELLLRQYEQRDEKGTPYRAILYPKYDYNGVFSRHASIFKKLLEQSQEIGHRLRVVEWDSKLGLVQAVNNLKKNYGKIADGILGGHGAPDSIQGGWDPNKGTLYSTDVLRFPSSMIDQIFEENPTIILVACSTGVLDGIAREIADLGVTVLAPKEDTNIEDITIEKIGDRHSLVARYRGFSTAQMFSPRK